MNGVKIKYLLLVGAVFLILGCTPKATTDNRPAAPVQPAPVKISEASEWDLLQLAAKKEGKVVIYTSAGSTLRSAMQKGFKDKHGIDVEFLSGRGEEVTEKLKMERKAGIYMADLFIGGSTIPLVLMKPFGLLDKFDSLLVLPEVTDSKSWWGGGLRWLDKDHTALAFISWALAPIAINTSLVKPEELKSYSDLLNPKLKGKIVIDDPTITGSGSKVIGVLGSKIMNWDFVRELAKQEPSIERDIRISVEGLARGKFAVAMGVKPETVLEFKQAGSPLSWVIPREGTYMTSGSGAIASFSNMAHPNATRLFVNWLLTKEGQTIFSKAYGVPSGRLDVPTTDFDPLIMLKPGVEYIRSDEEEFISLQPEQMKMAREIFGVKR